MRGGRPGISFSLVASPTDDGRGSMKSFRLPQRDFGCVDAGNPSAAIVGPIDAGSDRSRFLLKASDGPRFAPAIGRVILKADGD